VPTALLASFSRKLGRTIDCLPARILSGNVTNIKPIGLNQCQLKTLTSQIIGMAARPAQRNAFVCSCRDSIIDPRSAAEVIDGPAPRPLAAPRLKLNDVASWRLPRPFQVASAGAR